MTRNEIKARQRDLAQQLVDHEASLRPRSAADVSERQPVLVRLQPSLVPLVGKLGFSSLLTRSLTLAKRESSLLRDVGLGDDCRVEGLAGGDLSGMVVLITHLIGLLTTLMGETLTLHLLRNTWPELPSLQERSVEQNDHE